MVRLSILISFLTLVGCSHLEVSQIEKDIVYIWLETCDIMETCEGYKARFSEAFNDGKLTYQEFDELEVIYNKSKARFYND